MTEAPSTAVVRVAFPTDGPAGLAALVSPHFGYCQFFTIVELREGAPVRITVQDNPPHSDCARPVELLLELGVEALIVRGIGRTPLEACRNRGLPVYICHGGMVGHQLSAYGAGALGLASTRDLCQSAEVADIN